MYDLSALRLAVNDLSALVPQIYNDTKTTDSILDDITRLSKEIEWGNIRGDISAQQDLMTLLDKLEEEIKKQVGGVYHFRGNVENYGALPNTADDGDVYNVEDTGANYAWTGTAWDKLSETFDLSVYVTIQQLEETLANIYTKSEVDASIESVTQLFNNYYDKDTCDEKYLTSHQDISNLATKEALSNEILARETADGLLQETIDSKANSVDVYTKVESDNKYLTEHQDITGKQDIIEDLATIRGNASNGNDAFVTISSYGDIVTHNANEFLTEHQSLEDYYTKEQTNEKIHEVVGNAPETLDTLEEIAARLEDGTIASQIEELQEALGKTQRYIDTYLKLTPEQEQEINNNIVNETLQTNSSVTIEFGTVNDIVIPETTRTTTVNAPLNENTSLELTSAKGVTINNTGETTVNLNVNAPSEGSVPTITLNGNYGTVEVSNASVKVASGTVEEVVVTEDNTKNTSVGGLFATNVSIQSNSDAPLSISNDNEADTVNLDLDAPNSTVSLFKTYNSVNSTVGDNTLIIGPVAHIGTLTVEKGNVIVKDRDVNNRIDTIINETEYTVLPYTVEVNEWADLTGIISNAGKYIINEDIIAENKNLAYGVFGSGNCEIDLNGKTLKFGRSSNGLVFIRGTVSFNVTGNGYVENTSDSYGIWVSSETSEVNIYGGTWLASTHCMYAEKGTINIYGGEFKVKGEDKKFLLNCLDSSYTSGKAHINVYGGKFYGFNPAQSMGEPGGPVSFVAPGYKVIETVIDNETVYEVVPE